MHPEKTLKEVLRKQRDTVEEIKKKTNYYNTRNLLEKYDEQSPLSPAATPLRRRNVPPPSMPQTPLVSQPTPLPQQHLQTPNGQGRGPVLQLSRAYYCPPVTRCADTSHLATPQPIQAARKHWYDKLADAILGDDDDQSTTVAASRYALICQKCFAHNGLVKENVWEDTRQSLCMVAICRLLTVIWTEYVCPKCGFFNPSARSKKRAAQRTPSPPSAQHPSPDRAPQQLPLNTPPNINIEGKHVEEDVLMDQDIDIES